ncbi:MAG TPA: hypothetical protein VFO55_09050 [Gemmatimonadaceae bacterium]|nr:hypothetical protein [Gemmatimonadaceae bacterium]
MRASLLLMLAVSVAVSGCERREPFAEPDSTSAPPPLVQPERTAYLSVSDLAPDSGGTIVVAGTIGVGESMTLGSFRVRLSYDSASLVYLEEIPAPGMMRVVNPRSGEVIVAGASSGTSADGRLFALRFRVVDPRGLESLSLAIDELNDGNFTSQVQTVTRSSRIVLDRGLVPGKVVPR